MKRECSRCEFQREMSRQRYQEGTLEPEDCEPPTFCARFLVAMVLIALLIAVALALGPCRRADAATNEQAAERKCRILWRSINGETYRPELADWFVEVHYRAGMGPRWSYSLAYCWSGSGLNPQMVSRGTVNGEHALGLVDTLWSTHRDNLCCVRATVQERGIPWTSDALKDPWVAVRLHVLELVEQRDDDAWRNLRRVFIPLHPDGHRALKEQSDRWEPRMDKIEAMLAQARKDGRL